MEDFETLPSELCVVDDNDFIELWMSVEVERQARLPEFCFQPNPSVTTALQAISGEEEYVDPFLDRVRQRVAEREAEETQTRWNTLNKANLFAPAFREPFNLRDTAPSPELDASAGPTRTPRWLSSLESTLTFPDWELPLSPQRSCAQKIHYPTPSPTLSSPPTSPPVTLPPSPPSDIDSETTRAKPCPPPKKKGRKKKALRKTVSKTYTRLCDICGEAKMSTFRPVISEWIGKQRLLPDSLRVMSCNSCYCSHSKHNPAWNRMKLSLLAKQLRRFLKNGIDMAELRLGRVGEATIMSIEDCMRAIASWSKERSNLDVGDGEISVRPCLPKLE